MSTSAIDDSPPRITVRVPGRWAGPRQLVEALPRGCDVRHPWLLLPDGRRVEIFAQPPDEEFPRIFSYACQREVSPKALAGYTANVCLSAGGGSLDAAGRMLEAAGAVVRAGGLGVFVDNSLVAHRRREWIEFADCPRRHAAFLAFVSLFAGREELWSLGMHVLGLRDAVTRRRGEGTADMVALGDFLNYTTVHADAVADGDFVGDEEIVRFQVRKESCRRFRPGSPMHNPYGRWRLQAVE